MAEDGCPGDRQARAEPEGTAAHGRGRPCPCRSARAGLTAAPRRGSRRPEHARPGSRPSPQAGEGHREQRGRPGIRASHAAGLLAWRHGPGFRGPGCVGHRPSRAVQVRAVRQVSGNRHMRAKGNSRNATRCHYHEP